MTADLLGSQVLVGRDGDESSINSSFWAIVFAREEIAAEYTALGVRFAVHIRVGARTHGRSTRRRVEEDIMIYLTTECSGRYLVHVGEPLRLQTDRGLHEQGE